jgi:predicted RNase H-like HicB family nuclease/DNA-binding XRE family transcriptional regulator
MKYHFKIHQEDDGFWAECLELDGCVTQAINQSKLYKNCKEVLNLFLEEPSDSEIIFPLPKASLDDEKDTIKVEVNLEIALSILLQNFRINSKMTQTEFAKVLGMKDTSSYQKLKKRPRQTSKVINKIRANIPEIELNCLYQ